MILFPGVVLPLMIGREISIRAIQKAVQRGEPVGLILQRDEQQETPGPEDLFTVGTMSDVVRYWTANDGRHHAICQGTSRFRVIEYTRTGPLLSARVGIVPEAESFSRAIEARFVALREEALEVLQLAPGAPEDLAQAVGSVTSPGLLADMVATFIDVPAVEKQEILETFDLRKRLDRVNQKLAEVRAVLALSHKIRTDTKQSLDKAQREYFLREQLRAIQRELGEGEGEGGRPGEFEKRVEALTLPTEVESELRREIARLGRMPEQAAEHSVLTTWLEVMLEIPWNKKTVDRLQLDRAARILDEDHDGLERVKTRNLEFLAVRKLNPTGRGPTLCLVGPPGVGKTSLGQSIARAMGRDFVRVSLGGVHDEAEIRGHRRTFVGAMPGSVISGLRRARSSNPVFVLDELDKLGVSHQGDPASALLEVLDPAQNHTFRDNYLGVPFDLSDVLFLATANVLETVPAALRDRLEVISIAGYTEEEKVRIARRFLVARQLEACGLKPGQCRFLVSGLHALVAGWTREAGVRNLEREIGSICRHVASRVARGSRKSWSIGPKEVRKILGAPRFEGEIASRTSLPGVVTGLAWTPYGGTILFIEASMMPGKGRIQLTGQLGGVMKESARAALTLARSRAQRHGIDPEVFENSDLHMHIPAGAVPKDGPSAGLAMYTALVSLLTGRKLKAGIAMTGEISLRGLVLPVGGVKEKLIAALAAGIRRVYLPERNRPDLEEVPESVARRLETIFVTDADEVIEDALRRA
jgi:ATP-dependent Lon protease